MFGASSIPAWTVAASWAQVVVLIVTAYFVRRYLTATVELRDAARKQVDVANDQLEAQIRPAITVESRSGRIWLVNIGVGAALDIVVWSRLGPGSERETFSVVPSFLRAGEERLTVIRLEQAFGLFDEPALNGRELFCEYHSLSGRDYRTDASFDSGRRGELVHQRLSGETRKAYEDRLELFEAMHRFTASKAQRAAASNT